MSDELKANAALLTEAIDALTSCDDMDYRIDMMLAYRPEIVSTLRALLSALTASEARAKAAEEALKPFAALADIKLCGPWRDDESIQNTDLAYRIKFAHIRHAASALKGAPDER